MGALRPLPLVLAEANRDHAPFLRSISYPDRQPSQRTCGPCTACCGPGLHFDPSMIDALYDLEIVSKGAAESCGLRRHGGCGAYLRRPVGCRMYRCAWLDGLGDDEHRPDLSGLMLDAVFGSAQKRAIEAHPLPILRATTVGQPTAAGGRLIAELARERAIWFTCGRVAGPPHMILALQAALDGVGAA